MGSRMAVAAGFSATSQPHPSPHVGPKKPAGARVHWSPVTPWHCWAASCKTPAQCKCPCMAGMAQGTATSVSPATVHQPHACSFGRLDLPAAPRKYTKVMPSSHADSIHLRQKKQGWNAHSDRLDNACVLHVPASTACTWCAAAASLGAKARSRPTYTLAL